MDIVNFHSGFACGALYGTQIITLIMAIALRGRGYLMRATMWFLLYFFLMSSIDFVLGVVWNPFSDDMADLIDTLLQATEVVAMIVYFYKVVYARSMPPRRLLVHTLPYLLFTILAFSVPTIHWEPWIVATVDIHALACLLYGYRQLHHYHVTLVNYTSTTPGTELRWIKLIMPLLMLFVASWNVPTVLTDSIFWNMGYNYFSAIVIGVLAYVALRHTLSQGEIRHNWDLVHEEEKMVRLTADKPSAPATETAETQRATAREDSGAPTEQTNNENAEIAGSAENRSDSIASTTHYANQSATAARQASSELTTPLELLFTEKKIYLNPELTLADLADRLGTNITYVSQHINRELHTTFYELVNGYRMRDAEHLLRTTELTLEQVSLQAGFNSQTSFYRYFKKVHGITPTAFRKGG